ncbi:hypothetical protein HF086_003390, partial [Spodoptera exigua]
MWLLLVILVTCLFYYSRHRLSYFSSRGVRTLPPVPFLGNLTAVTLGRENFVEAIAAGYNAFKDQRYFGLYQYLVPTLIPRDPELIRQIMVRDFNSFIDRGVHIDADCDPLFGRNLIMLTGVKLIPTQDAEQFSQLFKSALKARRENLVKPRPDFIQVLVDAANGKLKSDGESDGNNNESAKTAEKVLRLWPLVGSADRRSVATYDFGPTHPGSKDRLI